MDKDALIKSCANLLVENNLDINAHAQDCFTNEQWVFVAKQIFSFGTLEYFLFAILFSALCIGFYSFYRLFKREWVPNEDLLIATGLISIAISLFLLLFLSFIYHQNQKVTEAIFYHQSPKKITVVKSTINTQVKSEVCKFADKNYQYAAKYCSKL